MNRTNRNESSEQMWKLLKKDAIKFFGSLTNLEKFVKLIDYQWNKIVFDILIKCKIINEKNENIYEDIRKKYGFGLSDSTWSYFLDYVSSLTSTEIKDIEKNCNKKKYIIEKYIVNYNDYRKEYNVKTLEGFPNYILY